MATIYDVAREANVSITAVSLVLRDPETNRVGAVKKQRILDAARNFGYIPNLLARALSQHRTGILSLIVPMRDPRVYFNLTIADVLAGIQKCLGERGYHLLVYSHHSDRGKVTDAEIIQSKATDGVIFINTRICTAEDIASTAAEFRSAGIRFVMINSGQEVERIDYVGVDDHAIGRQAAEYLISRGHTRIAMLAGSSRSPTSDLLTRGLREGMLSAGHVFEPQWLGYGEFDNEATAAAVHAWFEAGSEQQARPTAVFCGSDLMAPFVYEALERLSLQVPRDVAVLGRGDLMFARLLRPSLTTFRFPYVEIGYRSAGILIESLKTPDWQPTRVLLETPIIERGSV